MSTIDTLRQRLENDYLEPMTDRTVIVPINGTIAADATSVVITDGILSPDEESLLGPGVALEIEYELVLCTAFDSDTLTATILRGQFGSVAASHPDGVLLRIPTRWPRISQEQALREALDTLFPPLLVTAEMRSYTDAAGWIPLPSNTVKVYEVLWRNGSRWIPTQAQLLRSSPLDPNIVGIQLESGTPSSLCVIRYGKKVEAPTLVSTTIPDLPIKWERLVIVDAAVSLMAGVDIDAVSQEYLSEQLRLERFPVRSGEGILKSLIQLREYLMDRVASEVKALAPTAVRQLDMVELS